MVAMEKGGAGKQAPLRPDPQDSAAQKKILMNQLPPDVIELGVPFTDPIADGPTIQTANTVSMQHMPKAW